MKAGPFVALTRHFVDILLAPPILTDLGADYLRRTIASLVAMFLTVGVFVTRVFFRKYTDLGGLTYPDAYLRALQADTLLMIAVPMLIVGVASVLLCPLLFPDETDYHVLGPLPVTRAIVFGAKLAAVAIAGAVIVFAVSAVSSFWFPLATGGRRAPHPALARVAAHAIATIAGSAWMFSAAAAIQGLSLVLLPPAWRRLGIALQAGMVAVLLLAVPFVMRLPATDVSATSAIAMPLVAFPPTWFFAVEQWLLQPGRADGYATAAGLAVRALALTLMVIVTTYAVLYRTAERLAGLSRAGGPLGRGRSDLLALERRGRVRPAAAAVIDFVRTGLTRSRLHQFVFVSVLAAGGAVLLGQFSSPLTADTQSAWASRRAAHAALAAPLLTALAVTLALRAAFLLPLDRPAAWVFRLTEDPQTRAATLDAVSWCFTIASLLSSLGVAALVQPGIFGATWPLAAASCGLAAACLVEVVLTDWNRVPFTCSYLPGKRVLAYDLGVLLGSFFGFVYVGAHGLRWSLATPLRWIVVTGLLVAGVAVLRRLRLRTWAVAALDFEDFDPMAVRTLGLLPDER